jgi:hypothetical protein
MYKFLAIVLLVVAGCSQPKQEEKMQDVVGDFYVIAEISSIDSVWTKNGDGGITILYDDKEIPVYIAGYGNPLGETKVELVKVQYLKDLLHKEVKVFGYWKDGRIVAKSVKEE